ncbi:prolipoprotein diacylglyceryl transferase [Massilia sp. BJB1822]|uniref:prolipoprotein diacylglyceryl transferase n=1 Tax=Massilia sp. BJB1822 TaxID=2744470 RepID=UPI001593949B|nr:prolipoprotein diacylglyceryl transferase family protein [Massilia sp. BJB1822]NVE00840.1 prolipoprotein diacylglyceryl transferase [Massilia sp. BJB1822]
MKALVLAPQTAQWVHLLFEWLALAGGFQLYRWQRRRASQEGVLQGSSFSVVLGCILGAAIGNKLVFWIEYPHLWQSAAASLGAWAAGQSLVGGLLGGLLGVELAKKLARVRHSTGDGFILPLIAGTVIGRIGCFLAGLNDGTYGLPTDLPWGVDFGDGVARHPTQIYDMLFVLAWGGWLLRQRPRWAGQAGFAFKLYLAGYLAWRLLVDAIKPLPYDYGAGLSGIQLVCLLALLCYTPLIVQQARRVPA